MATIFKQRAVRVFFLMPLLAFSHVSSSPRFSSIHPEAGFTCGRTEAGELYCWGGELVFTGQPSGWQHEMERVAPSHKFSIVEARNGEICGVSGSDTFCWELGNRLWRLNLSLDHVVHCDDCDSTTLNRNRAALGHPIREAPHIPGHPMKWFLFPDFASPVQVDRVPGTHAFMQLRAGHMPPAPGANFANEGWCGLDAEGALYCWQRLRPELRAPAPVRVGGTLRFREVALGSLFGCGLTLEGAAYCWGAGEGGQLGPMRATLKPCANLAEFSKAPCSRTPVRVGGSLVFNHIAAGLRHVCALDQQGRAYCWGNDDHGQLGRGVQSPLVPWNDNFPLHGSTEPAPVSVAMTFAAIAAGGNYTCGLTGDGSVYCWGEGSANDGFTAPIRSDGATCNGPQGATPCALKPVRLETSQKFSSIALATAHACGVTREGSAYCWGFNNAGQLGDGTMEPSLVPVEVKVAVYPLTTARLP